LPKPANGPLWNTGVAEKLDGTWLAITWLVFADAKPRLAMLRKL
jgi:hypothetical protein